MATTPVDILGLKYPLCKDMILKMSKKWEKRTKNKGTKWPKEGTFDVALCEEMDILIKNYKTKEKKSKAKEREEKRDLEKRVLVLFKKEGEHLLKTIKQAQNVNEPKKTGKCTNPFLSDIDGQFPLIKGIVEVTGEMQMEGQVELENKQTSVGAKPKIRQDKKGKKPMLLDCYKDAWAAVERSPEQYKSGAKSKETSVTQEDEEEVDEEEEERIDEDITKNVIEIGNILESTDKLLKSRSRLREAREKESEEEMSFDGERWTREKDKGRLRPLATQLPVLIKGNKGQYVPWATQDLEGLTTRLPDIHEGAGKWIKAFEEETMGKIIAVGDMKALMARILGGTKMEEILQISELDRAVDSNYMDGTVFDPYRPAVWQALRTEYPNRVDNKALRGEQLGETENPVAYVQRQLKRWKQETEGNLDKDPLLITMFRNAVVDAMPPAVKSKLEDVVGLNSKPHKEFCDYVAHAVEQHRKTELKLTNQEKELQRKLAQLQLDELTKKNKKKMQATVKEEESEQMTVMAPVTAPPAVLARSPAVFPPKAPQTPAPIVNVYATPPGQERWKRKPFGRGQGERNKDRCWGCGQFDHKKSECPTNPWYQPPWGQRGGWQQPFQHPGQSPVNPYRGPNQGY